MEKLYAEFSIPSKDLYVQGIKNGAKVTLKIDAKEYEGSVDFIAPKLDPQTDTLLLRAVFANPNRELRVGSYVEVSLGGFSYESVAKVPQNALIKTPDATVVYVIENGGVSMKSVKVVNSKDGIAMIESGVESDAQIAISNIAKLRPNSKVTIMDGK
jgi:membrane fusion protein (multidrug efflux system)